MGSTPTKTTARGRTRFWAAVPTTSDEVRDVVTREASRRADDDHLATLMERSDVMELLVSTAHASQDEYSEWHSENRQRRMRVAVRHALGGKARSVF